MDCRFVAQEELVEKYVGGRLDPALQDEFEIHILECSTCTRLVEMYEEARTALVARREGLSAHAVSKGIGRSRFMAPWLPWGHRPIAWAAISLVIIIVSAGLIYRSYSTTHQSDGSAQTQPQVVPTPILENPQYDAYSQTEPKAPEALAAHVPVQAGSKVVPTPIIGNLPIRRPNENSVLHNTVLLAPYQPQLGGLHEEFSLQEAEGIQHEIDTGKIAYPSDLAQLSGLPQALLGVSAPASGFEVLRPRAEVVVNGEPVFEWQALPGAVSYSVEIFDADLNPVQQSPALESTQWKSTAALESGLVYRWQVRATMKDGSTSVSPAAPRPEARFRVLDKDRADYFARFQRTYPKSHLLLGILYAHAGVLKNAEDELKQVPQESELYDRTQALLGNLKATRTVLKDTPY